MRRAGALVLFGVLVALLVAVVLFKTAVVGPQQNAFVVERLGRFSGVLEAGFHMHLAKPVDLGELESALMQVTKARRDNQRIM